MPRIFDNIERELLPFLRETIGISNKADFCVGYFNLRGWKKIDDLIEAWPGGEEGQCRLLIGMQQHPEKELRAALKAGQGDKPELDNQTAVKLKREKAKEFRKQLMLGVPSNDDQAGLQRLAAQLKSKKVRVKLFLKHQLHAKLYLCFRTDPANPITGLLGSSNLTLSGLSSQGELNVDVLDHDATQKLAQWFEDRWEDQWCLDISEDLIEVIEESWARTKPLRPYDIYVKMAYHLSEEAREGLNEFKIPGELDGILFGYQEAAVKIAAHHLNKRRGVLIGDVVGLGKTLMATALARIFQEDQGTETLIICPKNLENMWQDYKSRYRLIADVMPVTQTDKKLAHLERYRVVLIDESHNLRNREGKRYRAIHDYIMKNESRCILLSATPYNKNYEDLSNQLRLFIPEDRDLSIRPEKLIDELGEDVFKQRHQGRVSSLAAFEKSEHPDDWRELMSLYMVRRTRSFIQDNYAQTDPESGKKYLVFRNGERSYFPIRTPRTLPFDIDEGNPNDQYARLYADTVVQEIGEMHLPRYGLGNYISESPARLPEPDENKQLEDLSRAGKRLIGFCRTNLFKRLESSGQAFLQSIERHILRNFIFLYALENGKDLPLGTQDAALLDASSNDEDSDSLRTGVDALDDDDEEAGVDEEDLALSAEAGFRARAKEVYEIFASRFNRRFKWLRPDLLDAQLAEDIKSDNATLLNLIENCGSWNPAEDHKLRALHKLVSQDHSEEKILVFSQFADTVRYIEAELRNLGVDNVASATGKTANPTELAWRFSPVSNNKAEQGEEIRVLITTDVLSEGQNLQDCAIIVNYDLPWAIIRIIQRAGRVDRIGQKAQEITTYSFLPAAGVEKLIRLRARVRKRLKEHAEVVGTDEAFFEDEVENQNLIDLYSEKAGILDGETEGEVDLASHAYQIWKNATEADPSLKKSIPALPQVVYSTKSASATPRKTPGALLYLKTARGNDALAWIDETGEIVTQSQFEVLRAAECSPEDPALQQRADHHELVARGFGIISSEEKEVGGYPGKFSGTRLQIYDRLKAYAEKQKGSLLNEPELEKTIESIYKYPLGQSAAQAIKRQLIAGVADEELASQVVNLWNQDRLNQIPETEDLEEPQIVCSLGLAKTS